MHDVVNQATITGGIAYRVTFSVSFFDTIVGLLRRQASVVAMATGPIATSSDVLNVWRNSRRQENTLNTFNFTVICSDFHRTLTSPLLLSSIHSGIQSSSESGGKWKGVRRGRRQLSGWWKRSRRRSCPGMRRWRSSGADRSAWLLPFRCWRWTCAVTWRCMIGTKIRSPARRWTWYMELPASAAE